MVKNMFNFTNPKENMIANFLDVKNHKNIADGLTTLQNEISVGFNTNVVAISSINSDKLAAAFAKGFAETYGLNNEKTLIIDANLYNPCLQDVIGSANKVESKEETILVIDDKTKAICMNKEVYPADKYKEKAVHKIIEDNKKEYDHFIILVPEIRSHKEVYLLGDIIQSIVLVTQRNVTKKKDIYEAIQFFNVNKLPLAKTVVLK